MQKLTGKAVKARWIKAARHDANAVLMYGNDASGMREDLARHVVNLLAIISESDAPATGAGVTGDAVQFAVAFDVSTKHVGGITNTQTAPTPEASMGERMFPIMDAEDIPWSLIQGHEKQAQTNHSQSLARLAERGGLGAAEAVAVLEDRRFTRMDDAQAKARLKALTAKPAEIDREKLEALFFKICDGHTPYKWSPGDVADALIASLPGMRGQA